MSANIAGSPGSAASGGNPDSAGGDGTRLSDYGYELPQRLIAQTPAMPRDHSRLMTLSRADGSIGHYRFYDLPNLTRPGDLMVFNDSRVMPARLRGRTSGGGAMELLLLTRLSPGVWRAIGRPGRALRAGAAFTIDGGAASDASGGPTGAVTGVVADVEPGGERVVRLRGEELLPDVGETPLPPYITERLADAERYQTVYARDEGSAAAPTAGLHFTRELLARLRDCSVQTAFATLHVGWDSFRPVKTDAISEHKMHSEYWELSDEAAALIRSAKADGRRVISVGTTAARLLENAAALSDDGLPAAGSGWADIFIAPGHRFRAIDALITNFHLPRSTLLMLTSALAGRERMLNAYAEAIAREYRFYSFGDAMFIH